MNFTMICIADEIASAAELMKGKTKKMPVAIIKGYKYEKNLDTISRIVRDEKNDLFR